MKRVFYPGEIWLSYNFYMGRYMANHLLEQEIGPLIKELIRENIIEKWFFVRYTDPDFHIRLRIKLADPEYHSMIQKQLDSCFNKCFDKRLIWDVHMNCYRREVERYGLNSIDMAESIFHSNSNFILNLISNQRLKSQLEHLSWKFTLKYMDFILSILGYNLSQKINMINMIKNYFDKEFSIDRKRQHQINLKYRLYRPDIELILNSSTLEFTKCDILFKNYLDKLHKELSAYKNVLDVWDHTAVAGIIHMHCNRLFQADARKMEFILYNFLHRYYSANYMNPNYHENND